MQKLTVGITQNKALLASLSIFRKGKTNKWGYEKHYSGDQITNT